MNKKRKILILVLIIVLIIIVILKLMAPNTPNEKVTKYVTNSLGFSNTDGSNLYSKQNSKIGLDEYINKTNNNLDAEYEIVYFNTDTYQLTMTNMSYVKGISKDFTPTFDYTNNILTYTYRIKYNSANAIMEGSFNTETDEFICESTFAYNIDIQKSKNDICNKIKVVVEDFDYYARTLIDDPDILEYMKNEQ